MTAFYLGRRPPPPSGNPQQRPSEIPFCIPQVFVCDDRLRILCFQMRICTESITKKMAAVNRINCAFHDSHAARRGPSWSSSNLCSDPDAGCQPTVWVGTLCGRCFISPSASFYCARQLKWKFVAMPLYASDPLLGRKPPHRIASRQFRVKSFRLSFGFLATRARCIPVFTIISSDRRASRRLTERS